MHYVACGLEWRRVRWHLRPWLWIELTGLRLPAKTWRGLEALNFWHLPQEYEERSGGRGYLEISFDSKQPGEDESLIDAEHMWRVAVREGRWFTVELAASANLVSWEDTRPDRLLVTPDGKEERAENAEPDLEFWKKNTEVYLIENIPFGTVEVRVPRNARDAVEFALARAEALIGGLPAPEHIEIMDFSKREKPRSDLSDDLSVVLHFHGEYQD